jgi:hypothetical protein
LPHYSPRNTLMCEYRMRRRETDYIKNEK